MGKALSVIEEYLLKKGEESGFRRGEEFGFQKAVLIFIQNKLTGRIFRKRMLEDIQNNFGVDAIKAEHYLKDVKAK